MIGDADLAVSRLYGMLPASAAGGAAQRSAADNATVRNVFLIGPDKAIKAIIAYPMSTGRNFDELLRLLDSLQLTARHKVATPANWKQGEDVIILASLSDAEADDVRRQAAVAFRAIDGSGLARVDFLLSRSSGRLFVNEINTLPGFTTISMYAKLWAATGIDYGTLVDRLIALAIERHAEKRALRTRLF